MENELFREVSAVEMPKVLQELREEWPKHFILEQIIKTVDRYKAAGSVWEFNLYLSGDYDTGVYLHKTYLKDQDLYWLHIYTKSIDLEPLEQCLNESQLIPWDKNFTFYTLNRRFRESVTGALTSVGLHFDVSCNTMFYFPKDKELSIKTLPDDVYIDFLNELHAKEMNDNWPHKSPGSEETLREHIDKNFGLGIFHKRDKTLASSALSNLTGGIFVLYSNPLFRRKGYARLLLVHMVKEIRERGRLPFATVIIGNTPSESLFKNVGFETFSGADYIFPVREHT